MLQKFNNSIYVFILSVTALLFLSFTIGKVFFPSDVVSYFPLFSQHNWRRVHNSLLADPVFQFEPWRVYAKRQILSGILPMWNDENGLGVPFLANPQTSLFFPLTIIYFFLPLIPALFFIHAIKLFLIGFFTYQLLRIFQIGKRASFLGALSTSFSAFFMTWLLWPQTNVFLFFPILLLLVEKIKTSKNNAIWYVVLSFCIALAYFGGHPETFFQIFLVILAFSLHRFRSDGRTFVRIVFFGVAGIFLTSLQLFPFVEYLLNSAVWISRTPAFSGTVLPPFSAIMFFFPFILGAPHLEYYKSLPTTNFQESAGGYVGMVLTLLALFGSLKYRKNRHIQFWAVTALFSVAIAYGLPPISWIAHLPLFDKSANQRFIAIAGFSIIIIASFTIDTILKKKTQIAFKHFFPPVVIGLIPLSIGVFLILSGRHFDLRIPSGFLLQLQQHILLQVLTSLCFITTLFYFRRSSQLQFFLLTLFLFLQTGFIFWNYVPFTSKQEYYPGVPLIKKLQLLPKGRLLEVGNPSLRADSNMMYSIPLVLSYDALSIPSFEQLSRKEFPQRNIWGNPEKVSESALQTFDVKYIISDYDLRLLRHEVNSHETTLLPKLTKNNSDTIYFIPQQTVLKGVRFLTANFNRANTCTVTMSLLEGESELASSEFPCANAKDKMFYFLPLSDVAVDTHKKYSIVFSSTGDEANSIALWGSTVPYLDVFYQKPKDSFLNLVAVQSNSYLFSYPKEKSIDYPGAYKLLKHTSEELQIETHSANSERMLIKIINFPGWHVTIDGLPQNLEKNNVFLTFQVPPGDHLVRAWYFPYSFLFGSILSFATGLVLVLILLRTARKSVWWSLRLRDWRTFAKKSERIPSWEHAAIVLLGITLGVLSYLLLLSFFRPHFVMPETTAINWYTAHGYPEQQDYFYFITSITYVVIFSSVSWLIWLWRKNT